MKLRVRTAALTALCIFLWLPVSHAQVSPSVREYRLNMFDPEVSVLANRTFELMFDIARVEAGKQPWALPRNPRGLDFSYAFDGE